MLAPVIEQAQTLIREIEGTATVAGQEIEFEVDPGLERYLIEKGSVTLDGVSLTVNAVRGPRFDVMLVPYTLDETTFGAMQAGARVNLEVDILAKYVASLMGKPGVDATDD